ncbi:MAG: glycosyltransferase [Chloroflexi bacterium]|nr:glycosyltransferase [Chloroflexota bacterium]
MARILYLTQVLPYPLNTGAKVRQYYVLRYLSQCHEVTLVSFVRADDRADHIEHLRTFCAAVHTVPMTRSKWRDIRAGLRAVATGQPIVIMRDEIEPMQQLLARLTASERFDAVHADQVAMAQYALSATGQTLKRVLDLHNAMYLVTQRLADNEPNPIKRAIMQRETRALAKYEARLCARFDQVVFVTDDDRRAIESQLDRHRVRIAADRFTTIPICSDTIDKAAVTPVERPFRVTALGVMFWPPNAEGLAWFARDAWPKVRAAFPEARLTIVGKSPPPMLTDLHGVDGIEVLGFVPDVQSILAETAAFIVPLRAGGGMRVKILDTWCWGLPIVSTRIGAEGIAVRDGENILLADTADELAQAVIRVLGDAALADQLRYNGRRWIEANYDWRTTYRVWDNVYNCQGLPG